MVGVELFKADQAHRDKYGEGKPYDENNVFLGFALVRYLTFSLNLLFLPPWRAEETIRHRVCFLTNGGTSESKGRVSGSELLPSPHPIPY